MRPCPFYVLTVFVCAKNIICDTAPDAVHVCKAPRLWDEGGVGFCGKCAKPKQHTRLLTINKQSH